MSDMSLFGLNMETHVSYQIIGRIKSSRTKRIARIVVYGKSITESSASERDDVNTATPQTPFVLEATQGRAFNAIVTQTSENALRDGRTHELRKA
jgi:hypothetical protein